MRRQHHVQNVIRVLRGHQERLIPDQRLGDQAAASLPVVPLLVLALHDRAVRRLRPDLDAFGMPVPTQQIRRALRDHIS